MIVEVTGEATIRGWYHLPRMLVHIWFRFPVICGVRDGCFGLGMAAMCVGLWLEWSKGGGQAVQGGEMEGGRVFFFCLEVGSELESVNGRAREGWMGRKRDGEGERWGGEVVVPNHLKSDWEKRSNGRESKRTKGAANWMRGLFDQGGDREELWRMREWEGAMWH